MTSHGNAFEPQEGNGISDTKQKLYLAQMKNEIQEWVDGKLAELWKFLNSRASKGAMRTLIGIALVAVGVFAGGIAYVAQIDKEVARNTTKIESIEHTIAGQSEKLDAILDAVKK